ncbi:MAG: TesB-like acyl-CoA thioesterase 3 [Acidimicrobiales bacterium]|nr:TesB-like acyl-CoA thioesterase 3 [Acidimicrobiales bacterium]
MDPDQPTAPTEFDADTAVVAVGGGFRTSVSDRWDIGGNPNGGYLLSAMLRAAAASAEAPDPLTVTAHYLRPTAHGDADITNEVIRAGRRYTTVVTSLVQEGKERVRAMATFGRLADDVEPLVDLTAPPALPPPDDLPDMRQMRAPEGMSAPPGILSRFDLHPAPDMGWPSGARTGRPRISGWIRFVDGRPPDVWSLPLFADAFPPAVFEVLPAAWVPTLELTVHIRARPAPGWLRARFQTRLVRDGLLEEDGELWDSTGQLVAMSRQLALVVAPAEPDPGASAQ